jgi:deoxyribonuclease IV
VLIGSHVPPTDPLGSAAAEDADIVQIFLGDPQGWRKPAPRDDAEALRASPVPIYVHAPYLVNLASPNNKIRIPSRKILQQTCDAAAEIGAAAVIVHGGHAEDAVAEGFGRWVRTLEMLRSEVPLYIENTAGGEKAVARRFDDLARLWERITNADHGIDLGFCFDTCHAHAAGEELADAVDRVRAACGRIDLLHANDSRDPPGTGADRHANLGRGEIGADRLQAMIKSCGGPVVVETPGTAADLRSDIEFVREALPARGRKKSRS